MEQALDLLQMLSPNWYHYVVSGLDRIRQTPQGVIGVDVSARSFDLSYADNLPPGRDFYGHTLYTGTVLIHEACHVYRYEAGIAHSGLEGERACVETELAALLAYAPDSPEVSGRRHTLANIHRPECHWWVGRVRQLLTPLAEFHVCQDMRERRNTSQDPKALRFPRKPSCAT